jgi:hypothetical protein
MKFSHTKIKFLNSLQIRILLIIFIFLFVPIALLLNYNFVKMESVLQEKTSRLVLGNLEQIGNKIDNVTEDIMKISSMVSSNSVIASSLSGYGHHNISEFDSKNILSLGSDEVIKMAKVQKQINYVKNNFFNYKMHVFLFGADGIIYSSLDSVYNDLAFNLDYSKRYKDQDWYKTLAAGEKIGIWTAPFSYNIDSDNGKTLYHEQGEMLFTHFGVSGPLILSVSAHLPEPSAHHYKLLIDLKPALDQKTLDARILRDFSENANKDFANSLDRLFPQKLIPVIVKLSGISAATKVNQITKEQRAALCGLMKALPLTVWRFRPIEEAVVTSGGVSIKEINPKTMESKLISGLYFAGELIDEDGYTGGFNLTIAFSTGCLAGMSC